MLTPEERNEIGEAMALVWTRVAEYETLPIARAAFREVQEFLFSHPDQEAGAMCLVLAQPAVLVHCFAAPADLFGAGIERLLAGGRSVSVPRDVVLMVSMRRAKQMVARAGVERPDGSGKREYRWSGGGGGARMVLPNGQGFDVPGEIMRRLIPPDVRGDN